MFHNILTKGRPILPSNPRGWQLECWTKRRGKANSSPKQRSPSF